MSVVRVEFACAFQVIGSGIELPLEGVKGSLNAVRLAIRRVDR
jgi:hypothetical protein